MSVTILRANLGDVTHQSAILAMLGAYSSDPMGDGKPLSQYARQNLIPGLIAHPTTVVFLIFDQLVPRGIAVCFLGFSTFAARPLLNVHDLYVDPTLRGQGIGQQLLAAIEAEAKTLGCCKLTLEVQQNNARARGIYERFGFSHAVYAADMDGGGSLFMVKSIV